MPATLISAANEYGREIQTYSDGLYPLWVLRDSTGIQGVIQAETFEDAYGIAEDEFFDEADEATLADIAKECDATPETLMASAIFQESYGFRPNGSRVKDKHKHGIYQKDLNGEKLDAITPENLMKLHKISVVMRDEK